jgi:uncharacterized ferritin-like protein (DUF455 family)
MELRQCALQALCLADPVEKAESLKAAWANTPGIAVDMARAPVPSKPLPGRPARPTLVPPKDVPHRSPFTPQGMAGLLHSICHIEFNAINLALDAIWRYSGMPRDFYMDWLHVAREEARHFTLLREHMEAIGHRYGDFPAHDGLWTMCEKTKDDVVARMALVPRTLEARGLDASPLIQGKLLKVGTPDALKAVDILGIILRDEVGHVAIGNRWYRWLCERDGLDPLAHYRVLYRLHEAPRLKAPFNFEARTRAGFTPEELAALDPSPSPLPELRPL